MSEHEYERRHFVPACSSCQTGAAEYEVTAAGDSFDVCRDCVPRGRHVAVVRIDQSHGR